MENVCKMAEKRGGNQFFVAFKSNSTWNRGNFLVLLFTYDFVVEPFQFHFQFVFGRILR